MEAEFLRLGGVIILGVVAVIGLGPIGRGLEARLRGTNNERHLQHLEDRGARLEAEIDSPGLLGNEEDPEIDNTAI
jgi:hypothetical protein